ncbi:HNH endonuclease [Streptomyces phaeochromogenes]
MSDGHKRPKTPSYLVQAAYRIFGETCLRCGTERPLEIAHLRDWPTCRGWADSKTTGPVLSATWSAALAERRMHMAYSRFHDLGNVAPLCANCHTLYDSPQYDDVTERDILTVRNAAVRRPGVLLRAVDFIGAELAGRPGRCAHKDTGERRTHSRRAEEIATFAPLAWIRRGYTLGLDLGDPALIITPADAPAHYHLVLDQGMVDLCSDELHRCAPGVRRWSPLLRTAAAPA